MNLQEKSDIINSLLFDLKAEYLIALLFAEGMSQKQITVVFDGLLRRRWSTDISHTETEVFENGDEPLSVHLNRAGIYDGLPEALFHDFTENRNATGEDMARDSQKLKTEEKEARLFFRPFENELFFQRVNIAINENKKFRILFSDYLNGLIPDFWKIDGRIPRKYLSKLTRLLPFANQLAGDYNVTAEYLKYILNEEVNIEISYKETEKPDRHSFKNIEENGIKAGCPGSSRLGYDLILGKTASGFTGRLIVTIGPLQKTDIKDFFKEGAADLALDCFYDYFIPAELDVETKIKFAKKQNYFVLSDSSGSPESGMSYLGYNTFI